MKFLVDAQLPKILVTRLNELGQTCIHTSDLPAGNSTPDNEVGIRANENQLILITKDADFINSHLLLGRPANLLLISTGNISNFKLLQLFENHLEAITSALSASNFVELSPSRIIIHS